MKRKKQLSLKKRSKNQFLKVDLCLWKEIKCENADKEDIGLHNRSKEKICTEKGEGIFIIKRGKRRGL